MRYEIDIPDGIGEQLTQRARARGEDIVQLIERAVVQFVESDQFLPRHRRLPDPPIETGEMAASAEFPRSELRTIIHPQPGSGRIPEPLLCDE
jgi:hypothetical protein